MKILKLIKGQLVAMQMIVMLWAQTQVAIRLMKLEKKNQSCDSSSIFHV